MKPGVSLAVYCVALALSLVAYQNCADVTFSSLQLSSKSGLGLDMNPRCIGDDSSVSFTVDADNDYVFRCKQATDIYFTDCSNYILDNGIATIETHGNTVTFSELQNDSYALIIQVEDQEGQIDTFSASISRCPPAPVCSAPQIECNGNCINPACTTGSCGTGKTCQNPGSCNAKCVTKTCPQGQTLCNDGSCKTPACTTSSCGTGKTCQNAGTCSARCITKTCSSGQVLCNGVCKAPTCAENSATCTTCPDGQCGQPSTGQTCGDRKNSCQTCTNDNSCSERPRSKTITCGSGSMSSYPYTTRQNPDGGSKTECGTTCYSKGACANSCSSNGDCGCGGTCNSGCCSSTGPSCSGNTPHCSNGTCVECTSSNQCSGTCSSCINGSCSSGQTCGERKNSCQVCTNNNSCSERPRTKNITCGSGGMSSYSYTSVQTPDGGSKTECGATCYKRGACANQCTSDTSCGFSNTAACGARCTTGSNGCRSCTSGTRCDSTCQSCSGGSCVTDSCGSGYFALYPDRNASSGSTSRSCRGRTCHKPQACTDECSSSSSCTKCGASCTTGSDGCKDCTGGTTCNSTCQSCSGGSCVTDSCGSGYFALYPDTNASSGSTSKSCGGRTCHKPPTCTNQCTNDANCGFNNTATCGARCTTGSNGCRSCTSGTRCNSTCQSCSNGSCVTDSCGSGYFALYPDRNASSGSTSRSCRGRTCHKPQACTDECSSSSSCTKCGASCTTGSDGCKDCTGGTTCNSTCQSCSGTSCVTDSCGSGYFSGYSHNSSQGVGSTSRRCSGKTCWSDKTCENTCTSPSQCPKCGASCTTGSNGCKSCTGGTTCSGSTPYCSGGNCVECTSSGQCPGTCNTCSSGTCSGGTTCSANSCQVCSSTCGSPRSKTCSDFGHQSSSNGLSCPETVRPGCNLTCYREGTTCSANSCQVCSSTCGSPRSKTCSDFGHQSSSNGLSCPETVRPGCNLTCYREGTTCSANSCQVCSSTCGSPRSKTCSDFGYQSSGSGLSCPETVRPGCNLTCYRAGAGQTCGNRISSSRCESCTNPSSCTETPKSRCNAFDGELCCNGTCKTPLCQDDDECSPGYNCINDGMCNAFCEASGCPPYSECTQRSDCLNNNNHCGGNCSGCACTGGQQCSGGQRCVNGRCQTITQTTTTTITTTTSGSGSPCTNPCNWDRDCTGAGEPKCRNGCCGAADDGPGTQF